MYSSGSYITDRKHGHSRRTETDVLSNFKVNKHPNVRRTNPYSNSKQEEHDSFFEKNFQEYSFSVYLVHEKDTNDSIS